MTRPLGLRQRVVASWALGGLVLAVVFATGTWWVAASYLLDQRTEVATREALLSAEVVERGLPGAPRSLPGLLDGVTSPTTEALLLYREQWYASSLGISPGDVPPSLVAAAEEVGEPARQRVEVNDEPRLAVAVPLASEGTLVAVLPLTELDTTLRALSFALVGSGVVTVALAAVLGRWVAGRALRPLQEVTAAASAIAHGDLSARIEATDRDLRGLAQAFNANVAALEARVRSDERFAGDVSHELRSPLTTMANAVRTLRARSVELSPGSRELVALLDAEVERFGRIVADLLEISRDDAAAGVVLEPVRMADLVAHACDGAVPRERLRVTVPPEDTWVQGDRRRLERVVCNLVDNAARHAGGVVEVAVDACADHVRLLVDDAGPGVPEEARTSVFERFSRGPRARSGDDGAGLGLALVAKHVAAHSGQVRVEDRPGGGARFCVALPRTTPP